MRTHRLKDLPLPGIGAALAVLPDFDFQFLWNVTRLNLRAMDREYDRFELEMDVVYDDGIRDERFQVTLAFSDVKRAKLPDLRPSFCFEEVEVEDVSNGRLAGVRYRIWGSAMGELDITCNEFEVRNCVQL